MSSRNRRTGVRWGVRWLNIHVAVFCLNWLAWGQTDHALKEGDPAPDFSITTDDGKHVTPTNFGGSLLLLKSNPV
jgi:hypothetical protein